MRTVKQVSMLTGISVRALHHYDAIGLLKPTEVTEAGYRMYDDEALTRLQNIMLFRELKFPLKEIKVILDSPDFDPTEVLEQQIKLLELQEKHIHELINFAKEVKKNGVDHMKYEVFKSNEVDEYAEEVKQRWGKTRAYEEYKEKRKQNCNQSYDETARQMLDIFSELGALRKKSPTDKAVQEKVRKLQGFITEHYYTCTDVLAPLRLTPVL